MTGVALLAGMLIAGGVLVALNGWRPQPPRPPRLPRRRRQLPTLQVTAAVLGALGAVILTRWPIAAVGAGALGWFAAGWWELRRRVSDEVKAEAVALWVEMLRDTVQTAKGLAGVITATASRAPGPIREQVMRGAAGLSAGVPLPEVLETIGLEVDHHVADLVVTSMKLNTQAGGGKLGQVLADLAESAHEEADLHRRLEVARSKPRAVMRYVTLAIAIAISALVALAPEYLQPYSTAGGQIALAIVGLTFLAAFLWMSRLGQIENVERFVRVRSQ